MDIDMTTEQFGVYGATRLSLSDQWKLILGETYYSQIGFYRQLEFGEPRNVTASVRYAF